MGGTWLSRFEKRVLTLSPPCTATLSLYSSPPEPPIHLLAVFHPKGTHYLSCPGVWGWGGAPSWHHHRMALTRGTIIVTIKHQRTKPPTHTNGHVATRNQRAPVCHVPWQTLAFFASTQFVLPQPHPRSHIASTPTPMRTTSTRPEARRLWSPPTCRVWPPHHLMANTTLWRALATWLLGAGAREVR